MKRETPPEWLAVMEPKRLTSSRQLAVAASVSVAAVTRLLHGEQTSDDTVLAVADALGISEDRVWELHGHPRPNPFRLDREADALSPTQRAAVRAVVNAMLETTEEQPSGTVVQFPHAARRGRKPPPNQS